jgi:exonuclease SbcD
VRILHTSDWHLGRQLHQKPRDDEFDAFLTWLGNILEEERVEALVIAGDLFDTTHPSHLAQRQYFRFLKAARRTPCRHIIVVAGNHDAPGLVDAPSELLEDLDILVIGAATPDPADCVHILRDQDGTARLIVCAVPFLRDRDLLTSQAGETSRDREQRLLEGTRAYYAAAASHAAAMREREGHHLPILATGHLFAAGGTIVEDDGVRDLYVGGIGAVPVDHFPAVLDYVALGHIHRPQAVGSGDRIRYSGAPLAMGFGEAGQSKTVTLVDLEVDKRRISQREVPQQRRLVRLSGDQAALEQGLRQLLADKAALPAWLEVTYRGSELRMDLREGLDALLAGSPHELLRLRDLRILEQATATLDLAEDLEDLGVTKVFTQLLALRETTPEETGDLLEAFAEIAHAVRQGEPMGASAEVRP